MVNRWGTMAKGEFDFGFAVDWMRKDLGFALEESRANGAVLPVAALADQFYADLKAMGHGRRDTSVLVERRPRSEEHASEIQSLMRISYAVVCLQKNEITQVSKTDHTTQ